MRTLIDFAMMLRYHHLRCRNVLGDRNRMAKHAAIAAAAVARDAELAPTLLKRHMQRSGAEEARAGQANGKV